MTLDIAMGGSTNTVLHLLAAAHEGEVDFTMDDIDRAVAPRAGALQGRAGQANVHMEDVHRAGGIMAILGELDRAGLINRDLPTVHAATLGDALDRWDVARTNSETVRDFFMRGAGRRADAGRLQPGPALGRARPRPRSKGVIRDAEHAFSKDGGLAVLYGNLARGRLHREDGRRRRVAS